jgi:hypothetical protein
MKIKVKWQRFGTEDTQPWIAKFSGFFAPDGYAFGATPDEAVRNLLKREHTLVYSIPRRALRQRVDRLPEPPEPTP